MSMIYQPAKVSLPRSFPNELIELHVSIQGLESH